MCTLLHRFCRKFCCWSLKLLYWEIWWNRELLQLISVLGSQPADDVSHKPGGRLPLLSARPTVTLATVKRAATSFSAWWTEAQWAWTVCLRLFPDSVAAAILNPGPSVEYSMLTTCLPSNLKEQYSKQFFNIYRLIRESCKVIEIWA